MIETPFGFDEAYHLKLGVDDIADPEAGENPPGREHIDRLLKVSRKWDANQPLLIHCWAGVSRSMASAFTVLCDRLGPGREMEIAHGDAKARRLCRSQFSAGAPCRYGAGAWRARMLEALKAMGPAREVMEGVATELPLVHL